MWISKHRYTNYRGLERANKFAAGSRTMVLCAAVYAASSPALWAQTTSPDNGLDEIIVTAQRRAEDLQSVPVSITAVSGDELALNGVRNMEQLQAIAPAVQVRDIVGGPAISVRGISAAAQGPSIEQPLAVYLNGAYLPNPKSYNGNFFDVERTEILLGPQGTLYGRNAMSGVLNIITRRPGDKFGGYGQLEVGNYALTNFEGAVDTPFSDTFSARFAAMRRLRDGYFANGTDDGGETSGRASFLFKPSDIHQLLLVADYEKIDTKNQAGSTGNGATIYSSTNPNVMIPPDYDNNFAYGTSTPAFYRSRQYGVTAQYDYSFEPATLTVIGSYRLLASEGVGDDGFTLMSAGNVSAVQMTDAVSNFNLKTLEVRLASNGARTLQWVVGGYGLYQSSSGGATNYSGATTADAYDAYASNGTYTLAMLNPYDVGKSYAAFGDVVWTPGAFQRLHLTAGVRYSYDNKTATTVDGGGLIGGPLRVDGGHATSDAVTWRLAPSFDLTDTSMVYASAAHGYEAGGFGFSPPGVSSEYKPQYVTAFEIGSKNQFWGNRVRLNADVFYYDYKDKQYTYAYTTFDPATSAIAVNIGSANYNSKYWGSSLALQIAPTRADRFTLDLAYIYAEVGSGGRYLSSIDPSLQDSAEGDRERDVIPLSGNASYQHTFEIAGTMTLAPQAMFHYTHYATQKTVINGNTYALPDGTVVYTDTPDAKRFDVLLTLADVDKRWDVTAYVRNLTDRYDFASPAVYNAANNAQGTADYVGITPLPPRTFGLMASLRF